MASQAGGQYVFSVPGQDVNLVLSSDGTFPPPTSDFDIAVFTTANDTPPAGYEGSAFAPGGVLVNDFLEAPSLTLNNGSFQVNNIGGGSDTMTAGVGQQTIVGGIFTTIIGGAGTLTATTGDRGVVVAGDASTVTVNALEDSSSLTGELINLGAGNATVYATGDDTVNAGAGVGAVQYFHGADDSINTRLTITGAAVGGPTFTVSGGAGDSLVGSALNISVVLAEGEVVDINSGNATVNALSGDQLIQLGGANATVYADNGDVVVAGGGGDQVSFFHGPTGAGGVGLLEAVLALEGDALGNTLTVTGATGESLVGSAANVVVKGAAGDAITIGGAAAATVNALEGGQSVTLGVNGATVYAGAADTVASVDSVFAGSGAGLITLGTTNTSFLSVSGSGGGIYTVAGADRTLIGTANTLSMVSNAPETISAGTVANSTINARGGDTAGTQALPQLINLGPGDATVYADGNDTINAGPVSGTAIVVLDGGQNLTVVGATDDPNITIIGGADTVGSVVVGAASASIIGAAGDTIIAGAGSQVINGISGLPSPGETIIISGGADSVFAGSADTIGVGPAPGVGETVTGNLLFLDSEVGTDTAVAVGYGTFLTDTTKSASSAEVTVGTVSGGTESETFDIGEDFVFFPNTPVTTPLVVATFTAVDIAGVASTAMTLPDGTQMTLVGVTAAELPALVATFKSV